MKIAINKCYGGFDLSDKAQERLIELGVPLFENFEDLRNNDTKVWIVKNGNFLGLRGKYSDSFDDYENRTNELLIQVIEELGKEASGRLGEIEVVEIPDNIEWEIDEYDGIETIHEKHRSW